MHTTGGVNVLKEVFTPALTTHLCRLVDRAPVRAQAHPGQVLLHMLPDQQVEINSLVSLFGCSKCRQSKRSAKIRPKKVKALLLSLSLCLSPYSL